MKKEPLAIVGLSCRFPHARNLEEFWSLLVNGTTTVDKMSAERWKLERFFDPDPSTPNKCYQDKGSFLENIHDFDPFLFNISPAEAIEMSPSQKLMLELVWEAIEKSNIPFENVAGKKAGVYVGNIWSDFEHERKHKNANTTSHSAVGQSANIIANRVSYTFGFRGPSLVVDTGCSSSLVALHLACQSIWENSSEMAVVGGINHILDHDQYVLLSKFGGLSKKGQCSAFDAGGDGFVRGEGAGAIIVKTLKQAEADKDHIWAVINGSAMNNNGFNVNLPATSTSGQLEMLEEAYRDSGINPGDVQYVEAHGTGTKVGDPTEAKALGSFFSQGRSDSSKLRIGSVKTNIGHLEGAAGMAGLIKVVLAMNYKQIPESLHFNNPNPDILFDELKLTVNNELTDWKVPEGETRKAGVNSFGWGGTNAHTVLEEYQPSKTSTSTSQYDKELYVLPLAAKTDKALKAYAESYKSFLTNKVNGSVNHFRAICMASAVRKPGLDYRQSFVSDNKEDLVSKLDQFIHDEQTQYPISIAPDAKVVFVFPGQGSQWLGMGKELYEKEPVFRRCIDECDNAFQPHVDWSLIEELYADEKESRLKEIDVIQPALFAMEIALAKLWMSWGINPDAVIGHSMGEVASAYISGALILEDAANVICSRSKLMKTVSGKGGGMAVTELDMPSAIKKIEQYNGSLSVAVNNSPKSTVISGNEKDLQKVLAELEAEELFCRQVKVDVASHSPQMEPLLQPLDKMLESIKPQASDIPYYSTVNNSYQAGETLDKGYWLNNLRNMVRFSESMQQLLNDGHTVFIEMSPHPVLSNAINECINSSEHKAEFIPSLFREEPECYSILSNFGKLYETGYGLDWHKFYKVDRLPYIELPAYPMQRQTYQLEDRSGQSDKTLVNINNPLLGRRIALAGIDDVFVWENKISLEHLSFVKDHKVNDAAVLPGVSYIELLHAALQEAFGNAFHEVKTLNFRNPIFLYDNETIDTQLKIIRKDQHDAKFYYYIKVERDGIYEWLPSADGTLYICGSKTEISNEHIFNLNVDENDKFIPKDRFYEVTNSIGIQYGNLFRGINWIRINNERAIAHVVPNSLIALHDHKYFIHPAILDSCFQTIFTPLDHDSKQKRNITTFLSRLEGFKWFQSPERGADVIVKATLLDSFEQGEGVLKNQVALSIYDESGNYLAHLDMLEAVIIDNEKLNVETNDPWLYKVQWEKAELEVATVEKAGNWMIFTDHLGIESYLEELFNRHDGNLIKVNLGEGYLKIDDDQYVVDYNDDASILEMFIDLQQNDIKIDGIIQAAALNDRINYKELSSSEFDKVLKDSSLLLINIHKALNDLQSEALPRIVHLSNGLQWVKNKHSYLNIAQAPMWGLSKVLSNEQPLYNCQRVDMSYFPDKKEVKALFEILHDEVCLVEPEVVLREEDLYVSRLVTDKLPLVNLDKVSFSSESTVVVSGFRGAAIPLIEWMVKNGARCFALLSRSGKASDAAMETLAKLGEQGVQFKIYKVDVSHFRSLSDTFQQIEKELLPIKSIVHAAGVIEAKKIQHMNYQEYLDILAPKVHGTWNLHKLSLDRAINSFILFSSASSLIGLSGQGSYVSANTFIDNFAHYRKKMNLPATAINWGVIEDVGMVANESDLDKYARAEGFIPVKMSDAVNILDKIISTQPVQLGICKLDIQTTAEFYSALADTNYLSKLLTSNDAEEDVMNEGFSVAEISKEEALDKLEMLIKQKVASITKASTADISSTMTFKSLGIDSLMAIQLRNQLEKIVGVKLAVTQFWKHPSVQQFSVFLYNKIINEAEEAHQDPADETTANWLVKYTSRPDATCKLFCFHDAGGSSSMYESWANEVAVYIEVIGIELPGRGHRLMEQPMIDMMEIANALVSEIINEADNNPFAFFGHSMGGAIQFEVMKILRNKGEKLPFKIFTSSTPALFTYEKDEVAHNLTEEQLVARFPHLSEDNIQDEELRQSLMNILRGDLRLLSNYSYTKEESFDIPIISIRGTDDERVSLEQISAWNEETTGSFYTLERPGGHRYIDHDATFLLELLNEELSLNHQKIHSI